MNLKALRGKLIVSCQAWEDDPFHGSSYMARFALAAVEAGAAAIRANSPEDIRAIRVVVDVPVIGIQKRTAADGRILITPTFEDAAALAAAGAAAVAIDCTRRGCAYGALERLARVKAELPVLAAADIATIEEAQAAEAAGADFVLSTMRGYTADTAHVTHFDAGFIAALAGAVRVPVIAEGRIWTPEEAVAAIRCGALAVVVGSAITRPRDITARFACALSAASRNPKWCSIGVDLGGTNIKSGIVDATGTLRSQAIAPTLIASSAGRVDQIRQAVNDQLAEAGRLGLAPVAIGIATAGWVDRRTGRVVYATGNLPEWSGVALGEQLAESAGLRVVVENDANAFAAAEHRLGCAKGVADFLVVTLGTGVGAGCYVNGRLMRGAHSLANALGHMTIEPGGLECTCGRAGCLEPYANAAALRRVGIPRLAGYLACGCAQAVALLDPELIVLAGGLVEDNPQLVEEMGKALQSHLPPGRPYEIRISRTGLGYFGGAIGAAILAEDEMSAKMEEPR